MTNLNLSFKKEEFTEDCIRKSLYWFSAYSLWELKECRSYWYVEIINPDEKSQAHLLRLLNDQKLREKIDIETAALRRSIVRKVLASIESSL